MTRWKRDAIVGAIPIAGPWLVLCAFASQAYATEEKSLEMIEIKSSADGAIQRAMAYLPEIKGGESVPLLVVLHTWSNAYNQKGFIEPCLEECRTRRWALVHPDFRGPNVRPEACASPLAVQDVLDAVDRMKSLTKIDERRIYLVGTSGGGHMSLIMAARSPETWAGVSAWVPVTDIAKWHAHSITRGNAGYAQNVEACCGGKPGDSAEVDRQYQQRSPVHLLAKAKGVPIDINVGIHDGHTGSVPVSQSLWAFNVLARANGEPDRCLSEDQIQFITKERRIPSELAGESTEDRERQHPILFRGSAGPARVTIFEGGHEGDMPCATGWLATQERPSAAK